MKRSPPWFLLALAVLVFMATHFVWMAGLPERVASHFNGAGRADGGMPRQQHTVLMLLAGVGLPGLVLLMGWGARFFPPSAFNAPNADYWRAPENYPVACGMMLGWSVWLALVLQVWMTVMNYQIVLANRRMPPSLPAGDVLWPAAVLLLVVVLSVVWLVRGFARVPGRCLPDHPSS